jgi:Fe-S cluster assembly scaffold protein SufB
LVVSFQHHYRTKVFQSVPVLVLQQWSNRFVVLHYIYSPCLQLGIESRKPAHFLCFHVVVVAMKFTSVTLACFFFVGSSGVSAFTFSTPAQRHRSIPLPIVSSSRRTRSALHVSIGLGPDPNETSGKRSETLVAGVDYEVPNHDDYRLSRRSKLDQTCDEWFAGLLDETEDGVLGSLVTDARTVLTTPVPLVNDLENPDSSHDDWTPYVNTRLPWTPLVPAFGLEQFGLPVPRRNAETWRHFDVASMVAESYSSAVKHDHEAKVDKIELFREQLAVAGGWLDDNACEARLVYINGRFVPQLSKSNDVARNLDSTDGLSKQSVQYLSRLTDGFTDELASPVPNNDILETSYARLSRPNHNLGNATTQLAVNSQQGTACFAALNTIKTGAVAYVHAPKGYNHIVADEQGDENDEEGPTRPNLKPVLIVNAVTKSGDAADHAKGVACHPRTLIVAEESSLLSVVQSCVDLDDNSAHTPKLYNGYTQCFVHQKANVTHSYLEESGGIVTAGVERSDDEFVADETKPREIESRRKDLRDTHLEAIDVHIMGADAAYEGTIMSLGGSGRVRVALSVALLQPGAHAGVNGFSLAGGAQRVDIKTNIHHVAQGTTSRQVQKNMIGGRATGAFRGRIRVEQSAQQTESEQLSRTVLLSDKARAWAVPSLEIIADDVQCAHGATVSDLSEEELFYLRSRGMGQAMARNLLMYAFSGDVSDCVDPAVLGGFDGNAGLRQRVIRRLENLVPQGERAIKGEFQSI